ncbi:MAG: antitoxin VapB family protein [Thermoplasmata archaeon]
MAAKTVALDAEAYRVLARAKRPGETFSDVVKRTLRPRRPLTDFAGLWADMSDADASEFARARAEDRRRDRVRAQRIANVGQ